MKTTHSKMLITAAFAACVSSATAQTLLYSNRFDNLNDLVNGGSANATSVGHQIVFTGLNLLPTSTTTPVDSAGWANSNGPNTPKLQDQQTLELRVDLVSANSNNGFAMIQLSADGQGYTLFKDQDEIGLLKYWNGVASLSYFFWEERPLKNENVTLVLSFTRRGLNLRIDARVLDKDNANSVLFERTVIDSPERDPVLSSGAVKNIVSLPDLKGSPWPLFNPGFALYGLWWGDTKTSAKTAPIVILDNLEVWQYESPELQIQDAVVLSWPVPQGNFVLESASSAGGPWEPLPEQWSRIKDGKTEVSVLAQNSMKLFRLRQTQ